MPLAIKQAPIRSSSTEIPAECFNLFRLAQRHCGDVLEFSLPGLPGNTLRANAREWRCWNRRLRTDLLSWRDFQTSARDGLADPVPCELTVHHPYSRTIVHRVHDSTAHYLRMLLAQNAPTETAKILTWPHRTPAA